MPIPGIGIAEFALIAMTWVISVSAGGYVAQQKRRPILEGALFGCHGPLGILIEALMPAKLEIGGQ